VGRLPVDIGLPTKVVGVVGVLISTTDIFAVSGWQYTHIADLEPNTVYDRALVRFGCAPP